MPWNGSERCGATGSDVRDGSPRAYLRTTRDLLPLTCLALLVACGACKPDASRAQKTDQPATLELPTPVERPTTATKAVEPGKDVSLLMEHLQYESAHRPDIAVSADTALDALDRAGVKLDARHQYAGFTMQARYCAGGRTADGVAVAVCEYPTPAAAIAGKAFMDQRYAAMAKTARREAHGGSVLTIAVPAGSRADALVAGAFNTFTSL